MSASHILFRLILSAAILALFVGSALAEPCLLAYPMGQVKFRYDPARYEIIDSSQGAWDPSYAVAGQMLWDHVEGRVAYEVYQAPGLTGFEPSFGGSSEYVFIGGQASIVIDGWSDMPRQLSNIYVLFRPAPGSEVGINVDGESIVGLRCVIAPINVSTPTGNGFYSDTHTINVQTTGAIRVEILVFVDRNGNEIFDGDPCYSLILENFVIPTEETTWGGIKDKFQE